MPIISRTLYQELLKWKQATKRKPLVLKGARQVGKTTLLKTFAKEFSDHLYLNFEETPACHDFFQHGLSPETIIRAIELYYNKKITPDVLLIFDECQLCPNALNSLKYFSENAPLQPIAACGSLLGVALANHSSFPVGKVSFLKLYPLSFIEFLDTMEQNMIAEQIRCFSDQDKALFAVHDKCLQLIKEYFVVGGMPEAVVCYKETKDFLEVRKVQNNIIDGFVLDFSKYAEPKEVLRINEVWQSIPSQLAKENKKFIFSAISKSARAREYDIAINWLAQAGLLHKVLQLKTPRIPASAYANHQAFKLYSLDVGIIGALARISPKVILEQEQLFTEAKGALTENFVAQELTTYGYQSIYYWTSEGRAEVDFVIEHDNQCFPLEVKAGKSAHKRSLRVYQEKYNKKIGSITTLRPFDKQDDIVNYPLYLIKNFPKLSSM